jgi:hypothetical protein
VDTGPGTCRLHRFVLIVALVSLLRSEHETG